MALQKQVLNINFSKGVDTKTDPKQLQIGNFLSLQNTVFDENGLLKKRFGFDILPDLPASNITDIMTFNGNLTLTGTEFYALSTQSDTWLDQGPLISLQLSVSQMVRKSTAQQTVDIAVTEAGLAITTWKDSNGTKYYQILDINTSQIIVQNVPLPSGAVFPRCFLLGTFFIVTFTITISSVVTLRYIAIPINDPNSPGSAVTLSAAAPVLAAGSPYDGKVIDDQLYLAWASTNSNKEITVTKLSRTLIQGITATTSTNVTQVSTISVTGDTTGSSPIIWVSWTSAANAVLTLTYNAGLVQVLAPTSVATSVTTRNITSFARNGINTIFVSQAAVYSFISVVSDTLLSYSVTAAGAVTGSYGINGATLASKACEVDGVIYFMMATPGPLQPTYFLFNEFAQPIAKLAYSNGGGTPVDQVLSSSIVYGHDVYIGYLFKDLLVSVNKSQGATFTGGVYSQTGINISKWTIVDQQMPHVEIAGSLFFASGLLWQYDGVGPVELGFNLWPENLKATLATSGGHLTDQQYYYAITYEWTDGAGNIQRSAPSPPLSALATGGSGSSKFTLDIECLRMTRKDVVPTGNQVRIVIYRWSTAQPIYYQANSITSPTLNTGSNSIQFVDTLADSSILGNPILYTTGGVIENIGPPACNSLTLFKSRLMLLDAEDPNLIWYSKQVIESTPVEMSDLFTLYVAPTTGAQGSTGPSKVLFAMDDKVIIYKSNAIYYITGQGPDNTGANNDFSDPVFITATVGSSNQHMVLIPQGIVFQSNKGFWLLGRDLNTSYIGAQVEKYNEDTLLSAVTIPGTNQIRLVLSSGVILMYDYFYGQWGEFMGAPAIASTTYQDKHTLLGKYQIALQEGIGFKDNSSPTLISFTTGWISMSGIQGYQRIYALYLLGQFITPHKVSVQIAYDYNDSNVQNSTITPDNYVGTYGSDSLYGGSSPYGGPGNVEQWRVFFERQKCQAFKITVSEIFDASFGTTAGKGLTISAMSVLIGAKSQYPRLKPSHSVG